MTGDRLGREDVDERADRAARAEVGLEVVEQRIGCVRAAQEPECRGDDADQERGILGRALRPTDLPVAVEQRLAAGVALHQEQGALDDVDAACSLDIHSIAQRDGVADRRGDVAHAAGVDVALEGVELEVEGQPDVDGLDLPGGVAQQLGGALDTADGDWELASQPHPMGALDRVVRAVDDGGLGAGQQDAGLARHPGIELGTGGEPESTGAVGGVGRQPARRLPRASGQCGGADVCRHRRRHVEGVGHLGVGPEGGAGKVPRPGW